MAGLKQPSPALESWKEIADHLGVAVRTAQKWEREMALPVRRMPGEKGRVRAEVSELDRWRRSALHNSRWWSRPHHLRIYAICSTLFALALAAHEFFYHRDTARERHPTSFRVEWRSLNVLDQIGNTIWSKVFPEALQPGAYTTSALALHRKISFADIDGDGEDETLFIYAPVSSGRSPGALYCFSSSGRERWKFVPAEEAAVRSAGGEAADVLNDLLVAQLPPGSERRILLLDCRLPRHEATLFVLSPSGEVIARHDHPGHMGMLEVGDVDGCGAPEILAGGFDPERGQAELTVLEFAAARPDAPTDWNDGDGDATEAIRTKAVVAFPRTCINRKLEESNRIARITLGPGALMVAVAELSTEDGAEVVYQLGRDLAVDHVWFSDSLRNLHRALESGGVLDHPLVPDEVDGLKLVERFQAGRDRP